MTRKKTGRRPGRPRKDGAPPAAPRALPPVVQVVSTETSTADALAALDVAERTVAVDDETAPAAPVGRVASADVEASFPETPANGTKPAPPRPQGVSLTGKRFASMTNAQLQTALAIAHNDIADLKERLQTVVPETAAVKGAALERMTAVFCSALFDITALLTKLDEVRLDDDEERELGELGAPAIEPYLGEYGKHAPLLAFGGKLASVITGKVITVRILKEQRANARLPEARGPRGGAE